MMLFFSLFVAYYSEYMSHLKLQQCVNERNISSHILPGKYDTERCLGYPVCPTQLSVRHTIIFHHDTYIRMFQCISISNSILYFAHFSDFECIFFPCRKKFRDTLAPR